MSLIESFEAHWAKQVATSPVEFPPAVMGRLKKGAWRDFRAGWNAAMDGAFESLRVLALPPGYNCKHRVPMEFECNQCEGVE